MCVLGGFDPQDPRQYYSDPQKAHPYARTTSFEPLTIKIAPAVWAVRFPNGNKNGKKKNGNFLLYVAYLCRPPLYAINTILVWFHHIPDLINHANFGVDRVIGV
jgi:hypothetical protein